MISVKIGRSEEILLSYKKINDLDNLYDSLRNRKLSSKKANQLIEDLTEELRKFSAIDKISKIPESDLFSNNKLDTFNDKIIFAVEFHSWVDFASNIKLINCSFGGHAHRSTKSVLEAFYSNVIDCIFEDSENVFEKKVGIYFSKIFRERRIKSNGVGCYSFVSSSILEREESLNSAKESLSNILSDFPKKIKLKYKEESTASNIVTFLNNYLNKEKEEINKDYLLSVKIIEDAFSFIEEFKDKGLPQWSGIKLSREMNKKNYKKQYNVRSVIEEYQRVNYVEEKKTTKKRKVRDSLDFIINNYEKATEKDAIKVFKNNFNYWGGHRPSYEPNDKFQSILNKISTDSLVNIFLKEDTKVIKNAISKMSSREISMLFNDLLGRKFSSNEKQFNIIKDIYNKKFINNSNGKGQLPFEFFFLKEELTESDVDEFLRYISCHGIDYPLEKYNGLNKDIQDKILTTDCSAIVEAYDVAELFHYPDTFRKFYLKNKKSEHEDVIDYIISQDMSFVNYFDEYVFNILSKSLQKRVMEYLDLKISRIEKYNSYNSNSYSIYKFISNFTTLIGESDYNYLRACLYEHDNDKYFSFLTTLNQEFKLDVISKHGKISSFEKLNNAEKHAFARLVFDNRNTNITFSTKRVWQSSLIKIGYNVNDSLMDNEENVLAIGSFSLASLTKESKLHILNKGILVDESLKKDTLQDISENYNFFKGLTRKEVLSTRMFSLYKYDKSVLKVSTFIKRYGFDLLNEKEKSYLMNDKEFIAFNYNKIDKGWLYNLYFSDEDKIKTFKNIVSTSPNGGIRSVKDKTFFNTVKRIAEKNKTGWKNVKLTKRDVYFDKDDIRRLQIVQENIYSIDRIKSFIVDTTVDDSNRWSSSKTLSTLEFLRYCHVVKSRYLNEDLKNSSFEQIKYLSSREESSMSSKIRYIGKMITNKGYFEKNDFKVYGLSSLDDDLEFKKELLTGLRRESVSLDTFMEFLNSLIDNDLAKPSLEFLNFIYQVRYMSKDDSRLSDIKALVMAVAKYEKPETMIDYLEKELKIKNWSEEESPVYSAIRQIIKEESFLQALS